MFLTRPTPLYKSSFLEAYKESIAEGSQRFFSIDPTTEAFENYCRKLISQETGDNLPAGYVNATNLWLIDKDSYIGKISIRHSLTEHLLKVGGQIGYIIAPRYRKLGYGTKILELGLKEAANLGLKKVLVTCNLTNIGSAKIIEYNGGILENEVFDEEASDWKKRYWIDISGLTNDGKTLVAKR